MIPSTRLSKALAMAEWLHADQKRKVGKEEVGAIEVPYLTHLTEVLAYAIKGGADEDQMIAALLHDAIEDQEVTPNGLVTAIEIVAEFGQRPLDLVMACTDGVPGQQRDGSTWQVRKESHMAHLKELGENDPSVLLVSVADKLSNARSIVSDVKLHGNIVWDRFNAKPDQIAWYYESMLAIYIENPAYGPKHSLVHALADSVAELRKLADSFAA
jgi:(p)ppGpp synthase/HD superfamily hydrolase